MKLADLYARRGDARRAADTLFLALKMQRSASTARKLLEAARAVPDKDLAGYAAGVLGGYGNLRPDDLCRKAGGLRDFFDNLGAPRLSAPYRQWLEQRKKI